MRDTPYSATLRHHRELRSARKPHMPARETHILSPENEQKARRGLFTQAICGTPDVWHNWTPAHQYATCKRCRVAAGISE